MNSPNWKLCLWYSILSTILIDKHLDWTAELMAKICHWHRTDLLRPTFDWKWIVLNVTNTLFWVYINWYICLVVRIIQFCYFFSNYALLCKFYIQCILIDILFFCLPCWIKKIKKDNWWNNFYFHIKITFVQNV